MKKKIFVSCILLLAALSMQFCGGGGRNYATPAFYEKAGGHRVIAILPYQMIFKGKKPKKLTPKQVRKIEEMESLAFQASLYELLMDESTVARYPVRIAIQPIKKTNRILERHNISIRDSWDMESVELARILRVDAVVRTRVMKKRFMSGGASFGIELGTAILDKLLFPDDDTPFIFRGLRLKTNAIRAESVIANAHDGDILWNIDLVDDTDWRNKANTIIHNINHYFAKKFPYR